MVNLAFATRLLWEKKWLIVAVTLLSTLGGLTLALTRPILYESRAVFALRDKGLFNDPLRVGLSGAQVSPPAQLFFTEAVLTGEELVDSIVRNPDLLPLILPEIQEAEAANAVRDPTLLRRASVRLRTRMVRTQVYDEQQLVVLSIMAKDTSAAVRLVWAFYHQANHIVQKMVWQEVDASLRELMEAQATTIDPLILEGINNRVREEIEKRMLVSSGFLSVVKAPAGALFTSEPRKKQLVALSFLVGLFFSALSILLSNKSFRRRLWALREAEWLGYSPNQPCEPWRIIAGAVLVFMLLYNLSFKLAPSVSSARIAILFLLCLGFEKGLRLMADEFRRYPFTVLILVWCVGYGAVAMYTAGNGDSTQVSRSFHFLVYCFFGATIFAAFIRHDWNAFHLCVTVATIAQAVVHIYSFFSPDYRALVDALLVQDSNFSLTLGRRPPGFSNGAGAAFSVIQAIGLLSCLITLRKARTAARVMILSLGVGLLFISAAVSGRTGMLMSVIFMLYFIGLGGRKTSIPILATFALLGTILFLFNDSIRLFLLFVDPALERDFGGMAHSIAEIFQSGKVDSISELTSMVIPPLSFETLLGVGRSRVEVGAGHDAGYVQTYYSLGLLMAIVFYVTLLFYLGRLALKANAETFLAGMLVVVMFVIEVKEPFIFKYAISFYVIISLRLRAASSWSMLKNI